MGIVTETRRPRVLSVEVCRLAVAGNVHEVVVVDVDAMLARWPKASVLLAAAFLQKVGISRTTPCLEQRSVFVELQNRGSRDTARGLAPVTSRMTQHADRIALRVLAPLAKSAGVGGVERTRP